MDKLGWSIGIEDNKINLKYLFRIHIIQIKSRAYLFQGGSAMTNRGYVNPDERGKLTYFVIDLLEIGYLRC